MFEFIKKMRIPRILQQTNYGELLMKIEKTMIPRFGQCDYLQGELLRVLWKCYDEAWKNGNINCGEHFDTYYYYVSFLKEHIAAFDLPAEEKMDVLERLERIAECYQDCKIADALEIEAETDEEYDEKYEELTEGMGMLIEDDEFYVPLFNAVGWFCKNNPAPVTYQKKPDLYN